MNTRFGTTRPSVGATKRGKHAGLFEVLAAGEPALDHAYCGAVAGELIDQHGAVTRVRALRQLARQHIGARAQPFARLLPGDLLGRLPERIILQSEDDDTITAGIDIEQAAQKLCEAA